MFRITCAHVLNRVEIGGGGGIGINRCDQGKAILLGQKLRTLGLGYSIEIKDHVGPSDEGTGFFYLKRALFYYVPACWLLLFKTDQNNRLLTFNPIKSSPGVYIIYPNSDRINIYMHM